MIKAIIFDLGGVVLKDSYESVFEHLGKPFSITAQEAEKIYAAIKEDWSLGLINSDHASKHFIQSLSSKIPQAKIIKEWKRVHEKDTEFNKNILRLIKKLRKNYKVYLLTNTMDLHYNVVRKRGIYKYFDNVYTSFELGKRKPNPDIYEHLLEDTNLKPQECIFIDDKAENVKAARKLKIRGIIFKNYQSLATSFKKIKITF